VNEDRKLDRHQRREADNLLEQVIKDPEAAAHEIVWLRAALAERGWHPIETAPDEEETFLVLCDGSPFLVDRIAGRWFLGGPEEVEVHPTHWMPILDPPLRKPEAE